MTLEWATIAATEVAWTILCLWGVWRHARMWRAIDRDVDLLESGVIPVSPGALALFRNDRATELDWVVMKTLLAGGGIVQMFADNRPRSDAGWVTVALLFAAILWIRSRSEARGRRRAAVKHAATEDRHG